MVLSFLSYGTLVILFYLYFKISGNEKYLISNKILFAIISFFSLLSVLSSILVSWYGGYLPELVSFYQENLNTFFTIRLILCLILILLPILNFWLKFRKSKAFQTFILLTLFIFLGFELYAFFSIRDVKEFFALPIQSGWHTTIPALNINLIALTAIILLGIVLNLIIVKFSLLPELKKSQVV